MLVVVPLGVLLAPVPEIFIEILKGCNGRNRNKSVPAAVTHLVFYITLFITGGRIAEIRLEPVPCGQYPFFVLQWTYKGVKPQTKLVLLSNTMLTMKDFFDVEEVSTHKALSSKLSEAAWSALDAIMHQKWQEALALHKKQTEEMCQFRKAAYLKNYESRLASLQTQLNSTTDEKLVRMRQSQLVKLQEERTSKLAEFDDMLKQADVLITKLVEGIITVE